MIPPWPTQRRKLPESSRLASWAASGSGSATGGKLPEIKTASAMDSLAYRSVCSGLHRKTRSQSGKVPKNLGVLTFGFC
ncbi:MAG: hypothetical protein LBU32_06470 [Clostridiales bacterium]|nr:hypothetical protein [Clostridiales bacterium]